MCIGIDWNVQLLSITVSLSFCIPTMFASSMMALVVVKCGFNSIKVEVFIIRIC